MLESGPEPSAIGVSLRGARHGRSRRWLEFSESKDPTAGSRANKQNDPNTISGSDFRARSLLRFCQVIQE